MKCKGFICLLALLSLIGCAQEAKSNYKSEIREEKVTLYNASFSYNATLSSEDDVPFVVVVEGNAILGDSNFLGEPTISFDVLGGKSEVVTDFHLNASGTTYEGEFNVALADTGTYSTQTTMDGILALTKLPNIHIQEIKNLEGQNCNFIYFQDKNELTYPDGKCRVNTVYERTGGADTKELYRVSVHVEDGNTLSVSVIPQ